VIAALVTGLTTAWKLGMPFGQQVLIMVTVLAVVVLARWPDLQDARTRRFQAGTDRLVQAGHAGSCPAPKPPEPEAVEPGERWWQRCWWRWVKRRHGGAN
jgi:hypothetical protein